MSLRVFVQSVSVMAPGLENWQQAQTILRKPATHELTAIDKLAPSILPPNERRRTTQLIKLALHVAEQACAYKPGVEKIASVFASSDGDFAILDKNTDALTKPGHPVSPTNFHNSVHNAAAGYWAIAAGAQTFSTSLSAGEATFAAGLLEAMTFCCIETQPVLCVAYEYPPASILYSARAVNHPFAVAMVLHAQQDEASIAEINLLQDANGHEKIKQPTILTGSLETLRLDNPAARALTLLECLALNEMKLCHLPYLNQRSLTLEIKPCKL